MADGTDAGIAWLWLRDGEAGAGKRPAGGLRGLFSGPAPAVAAAALGVAGAAVPGLGLPATLGALALAGMARRSADGDGALPPPGLGRGAFFLGTAVDDGAPLWLDAATARGGVAVIGRDGGARSEVLDGLAANAVAQGSGCLLVIDADHAARFARLRALAARVGRTEDLLVLNFTEAEDDGADMPRSNTLNPFASGGADVLTRMVVDLMDGSDDRHESVWRGRAISMFTGVMRALVFLRNDGLLDLDVGAIRDHLNLRRIIDLADEGKHPGMPANVRKSVTSYLASLPGYRPEKGYGQAQTTLDNHGYLEMQFTRIMGSLADVYGHVFMAPAGEVDMFDVVLNRRILLVLLPALGKSKEEVANLGKVVMTSLKRTMGATLGNTVEDGWLDTVDRRMTTGPSPFAVVLDEVGHYCVGGMDLVAERARSLGFAISYGVDVPPAPGAGPLAGIIAEAAAVISTDPAQAGAGAVAYRPMPLDVDGGAGKATPPHDDDRRARMELMDRINRRDLVDREEGEMEIIQGDWVVRTTSFVAGPVSAGGEGGLRLRANHFVRIPKPDAEDVDRADSTREAGTAGDGCASKD